MNLQTCGKITTWVARVLATLIFAFIMFLVIGTAFTPDGLPPLWRGPLAVRLDTLALILMVGGGVVGWKWRGVAAAMTLTGYALWQVVERRLPWPPEWIEVVLVIGLLYAVSWWSTKRPRMQPRKSMQ